MCDESGRIHGERVNVRAGAPQCCSHGVHLSLRVILPLMELVLF